MVFVGLEVLPMARQATVVPHLTPEALRQRFERTRDAVAHRRLHFIYLVVTGSTIKAAAQTLDYAYEHARDIIKKYNSQGPDAMDREKPGPKIGQKPSARARLDGAAREELRQALRTPPADGGLWTAVKVAAWMTARTGVKTSPGLAWLWLKRLGFSKLQPRPRHTDSSLEEQETFQKKRFPKKWIG